MYEDEDNDGRFPDESPVDVRHPRSTQREYGNFRDRFRGYAERIHAAYSAKDREESITQWRRVFGDEFAPVP